MDGKIEVLKSPKKYVWGKTLKISSLSVSPFMVKLEFKKRKCLNVLTVCTNFGLNVHTPVNKKAPNDLKTLPMGILHDYMSCWTTLGPFAYPRSPIMAQKQH